MRRFRDLPRLPAVAAIAGILAVSILHLAVPVDWRHSHNILQQLYYLPIAVAALTYGWAGWLCGALLAGALNAPHLIEIWPVAPADAMDEVMDAPLFCAAGLVIGVLAGRERKNREELVRTTRELSRVYRELQQNFEQMKRAERLYAVGQLAAGLAHEVRNPLSSIQGAAGILQRNPQARNGPECLEIINRECQRLSRLLTNFLDFARPRQPRFQLLEVEPLLDSVISLGAHASGRRSLVLRKEMPVAPLRLEGDPEQLTQVFLNLIINAIQASPEDSEVTLSAQPRNGRVLIQVRDRGCGVHPGDRDRIFDPFFTTKESGTGLGLPVAHQIVEQHGGLLTAESNPEGGMTFSVLLPAQRQAPA